MPDESDRQPSEPQRGTAGPSRPVRALLGLRTPRRADTAQRAPTRCVVPSELRRVPPSLRRPSRGCRRCLGTTMSYRSPTGSSERALSATSLWSSPRTSSARTVRSSTSDARWPSGRRRAPQGTFQDVLRSPIKGHDTGAVQLDASGRVPHPPQRDPARVRAPPGADAARPAIVGPQLRDHGCFQAATRGTGSEGVGMPRNECPPSYGHYCAEVEAMITVGRPLAAVERMIERAPIEADQRSALWLLAWATHDHP